MLEYVLKPLGVEVIRTQVGDIKVAMEIEKSHAFLGGENAGTYIWPFFHLGPDSLITITMLLKFLSQYEAPFEELIQDIPEFPFIQSHYELAEDQAFTHEIYEAMANQIVPALEEAEYHNIETNYLDGVRINFDEGWMLIRKSVSHLSCALMPRVLLDFPATERIRDIAEKIILNSVQIK